MGLTVELDCASWNWERFCRLWLLLGMAAWSQESLVEEYVRQRLARSCVRCGERLPDSHGGVLCPFFCLQKVLGAL
jgi:hypothetical protein